MVSKKRGAKIEIINNPAYGGKLIRLTHKDGSISGYIKRDDSNRIFQLKEAKV